VHSVQVTYMHVSGHMLQEFMHNTSKRHKGKFIIIIGHGVREVMQMRHKK